jgi:hypothetical protein
MAHEMGLGSLSELNDAVDDWLVKIDGHQLAEFCESRGERFAIEQPQLEPWLPEAAPVIRQSIDLVVSRESTIRHETNRYSVPAQYIGRIVSLLVSPLEQKAELVAEGKSIREFILLPAGMHESRIEAADVRSLRLRWERENRRPRADRVKDKATVKMQSEVAVEVRSPSWYEQLAEVGA